MIIHHGYSSNRGHYYSLIKNPRGGWIKFDDEKITVIEDPEKFLSVSQKAYILFYQKKWLFEAPPLRKSQRSTKQPDFQQIFQTVRHLNNGTYQ